MKPTSRWPTQQAEDLPRTEGSGCRWTYETETRSWPRGEVDEQIRKTTPDNDTLVRWAARPARTPPQRWWDEKEDPFSAPTDDE